MCDVREVGPTPMMTSEWAELPDMMTSKWAEFALICVDIVWLVDQDRVRHLRRLQLSTALHSSPQLSTALHSSPVQ